MLFLDESGTPPSPNAHRSNNFFVIGGLVIPEHLWHRVRDGLLGTKLRFGVRGEVKWRYFAPENTDAANPMREMASTKRYELRSAIFQLLRDIGGLTALACITSTSEVYGRGIVADRDALYEATYRQVSERFQYHLRDVSKQRGERQLGMIVCDHRSVHDDARLRNHHEELLLARTKRQGTYPDLVEGLFLQSSHLSVGIQLADMIAGAVWRKYEKNDARWFEEIKPIFRRRAGLIDGAGLVRFPKPEIK